MSNKNQDLLDDLINDPSFKNWVFKKNMNDSSFWDSWISDNPEHVETLYIARDIVLGISFERTTIKEEELDIKLNLVLKKIESNTLNKRGESILLPTRRRFKIMAIAAMVLIFATIGFYQLNTTQEVSHKTAYGEVLNVKLPDGTTAVLNGNSELSYKKGAPRAIRLKGEAYFKVKPILATNAKFWVTTNDLQVEVYGTQFNVNTRDKRTNVLLDEGSIHLLLDNGISKKMIPGDIVSYSKESQNLTQDNIDKSPKHTLWRGSTYTFNNVSLQEVMKYIEYAYGIPSEFSNEKLKNITISGGIPNENLRICLDAIQKSTGITIIRKDNKLLIKNN